jgi:hypothetical protein
MRTTEKISAILILALISWGLIMFLTTELRFEGSGAQRILRIELGSDASSLSQAVAAVAPRDAAGVARNVGLVTLNTYMDFLFIGLYWGAVVSLACLAGRLGKPFFAWCAGVCVSIAAVSDIWENRAILSAMGVERFTDQLAVDISECSQWKWAFFFLAALFLGLAVALNHHVSQMRRLSGAVFILSAGFGMVGISRYRVSLEFAMNMIWIGTVLFSAGLLLTLWKLYHSLKQLNHRHPVGHEALQV